jgi:CPA2 family monovalent cation:H+ antiporter-2
VRTQVGTLVVVILCISAGKALILAGVVRAFGYRRVVPLAVGLTLFQVGEFAFVLARSARSAGAIADDQYALVLNTAVATMALTPMVSGLTSSIYERFARRKAGEAPESSNMPRDGLSGHVVVGGAGRVGRTVADALVRLDLACVLIELNDARVRQARDAGVPVIYGDATHRVVLEAAGVTRARAILITIPVFIDVRTIVAALRQLGIEVPIIARAEGPDAVAALDSLGVHDVTSPEYEAAIEMTRQALAHFDVPAHEIQRVASAIRRERYGPVDVETRNVGA